MRRHTGLIAACRLEIRWRFGRWRFDRVTRVLFASRVPRSEQDVVPLRTAARVWALVGLQSFGGPAGQIAVMHRTQHGECCRVSWLQGDVDALTKTFPIGIGQRDA